MEADWSVEIGRNLPRIVVPWESDGLFFVDLRNHTEAARLFPETQGYPAFARALMDLNAPSSLVFTSKCDVWGVAASDLDWSEMETTADNAVKGIACYIDLLRREEEAFAPFDEQEAWLRRNTAVLRARPCRCGRVELVLRAMSLGGWKGESRDGFAITLYLIACGRDEDTARENWDAMLAAAVPILTGTA